MATRTLIVIYENDSYNEAIKEAKRAYPEHTGDIIAFPESLKHLVRKRSCIVYEQKRFFQGTI